MTEPTLKEKREYLRRCESIAACMEAHWRVAAVALRCEVEREEAAERAKLPTLSEIETYLRRPCTPNGNISSIELAADIELAAAEIIRIVRDGDHGQDEVHIGRELIEQHARIE